ANIQHRPITEQERVLFFYDLLNRTPHFLSEKELLLKAQSYADSYGQLKRLGLKVEETPEPLRELMEAFYTYEQEYLDKQQLYDPENRMMKSVETSISNFPFSHVVIEG